jgi:hypothetical protein
MITLGRFSIGPFGMPAPAWWRRQQQERARRFEQLEHDAAEMARTVREHAPSSRSQGDPASRASARLNVAAIYEARAAVRSALPPGRDPLCATNCYGEKAGWEPCDQVMCKQTVTMRSTPRNIADAIRERRPTR